MTEDREAKTESALKNPERLWVWTWRQGSCGGHSNHADQARAREEHRHAPWNCSTAPVEEYIRADVATAEADERAAGIRDALAANLERADERIAALREGIRKAVRTCSRQDKGHVECWRDGLDALEADDATKEAKP